jgi:predicted phosphodiesterase
MVQSEDFQILEMEMPRIAFIGDCHYRFYEMYDALISWEQRTGILLDAIVHVGDFGVDLRTGTQWNYLWNTDREVPIETYVCMGNHECIESISKWQAEPDRITRLHLLPDGGVTNVVGVKIASVWGNYSPKSWLHPERVKSSRENKLAGSKRAMHIYRPAVDSLLAYDGPVDVLITHDCSSIVAPRGFAGKPVSKELAPLLGLDSDERVPPGCPGFNDLLSKFKPKYYFYGHFHVRDYRELEGTKVLCLNAFDFNTSEAVEIVDFN